MVYLPNKSFYHKINVTPESSSFIFGLPSVRPKARNYERLRG